MNRNEVEGHSRRRRQRRQRQLLLRLRLLRGDCRQGRRPLGGDAGAGHAGPVRQQVRRQRLSRQRCTPISRTRRGRRPTSTAARSRAASPAGPASTRADVNRLKRFRDFTADVGGYLKKDRAWWYARLPRHRGRAALSRGCSIRRPTLAATVGDRQAHLQPVAAPDAGRLPAARDVRAVELLSRRHEPAGSDQRCAAEHRVPRERLEGRIQRRRRPMRSTSRRASAAITPTRSSRSRAPRRASRTSVPTPSAAVPSPTERLHQSPAGQRLGELHEGRLGRQPHLPDRRRVHARSRRRADVRVRQPLQLRLDAQQRRARRRCRSSWARTCRGTTW